MIEEFSHSRAAKEFSQAIANKLPMTKMQHDEYCALFRVELGGEQERRQNFFAITDIVNEIKEKHGVNAVIAPATQGEETGVESTMEFMPEEYPFALVALSRKPFSK